MCCVWCRVCWGVSRVGVVWVDVRGRVVGRMMGWVNGALRLGIGSVVVWGIQVGGGGCGGVGVSWMRGRVEG